MIDYYQNVKENSCDRVWTSSEQLSLGQDLLVVQLSRIIPGCRQARKGGGVDQPIVTVPYKKIGTLSYARLGLTYISLRIMTKHRYTVADLVRVRASTSVSTHSVDGVPDGLNGSRFGGIYEITHLLPELVNGEPQYRIRSCGDPADHVVRESQLIASPLPPPFYR